MLTYEQIEKIFTILYLNEDKITKVEEIQCDYNGFSNFGPYEDDELDVARIMTINGDGEVFYHGNRWFISNYLTIYIAGSHTDREYRINKEQLYTLAVIVEIINSKFKRNCSISMDLTKDYSEKKFNLYRKSIRDLLVNNNN